LYVTFTVVVAVVIVPCAVNPPAPLLVVQSVHAIGTAPAVAAPKASIIAAAARANLEVGLRVMTCPRFVKSSCPYACKNRAIEPAPSTNGLISKDLDVARAAQAPPPGAAASQVCKIF
jgi:hypothetical protein